MAVIVLFTLGTLNLAALLLIAGYLCGTFELEKTFSQRLCVGLVTTSSVLAGVAFAHFLAALPSYDLGYCYGSLQCQALKAVEELVDGKWDYLGASVMFALLTIAFAVVDQKLESGPPASVTGKAQ